MSGFKGLNLNLLRKHSKPSSLHTLMPALHSRTLSLLLEHHKPVPADVTVERNSITALPHPSGMPLLALALVMRITKFNIWVCNKEACREDTEVQGTEREVPQWMEGGSHGHSGAQLMGSAAHTSSWPRVSLTLPFG